MPGSIRILNGLHKPHQTPSSRIPSKSPHRDLSSVPNGIPNGIPNGPKCSRMAPSAMARSNVLTFFAKSQETCHLRLASIPIAPTSISTKVLGSGTNRISFNVNENCSVAASNLMCMAGNEPMLPPVPKFSNSFGTMISPGAMIGTLCAWGP